MKQFYRILILVLCALAVLVLWCQRHTAAASRPATPCAVTPMATSKAAVKRQPLKGKIIVLDAGHGGKDPGAVRGVVVEQHISLEVVRELKQELEALGATVLLTRGDNVFVSLQQRVEFTDKVKPDIFLSVHVNSAGNTAADGIEVFYYWRESARLAYPVFYALSSKLGAQARFVHKRKLYVTYRNTAAPSILAEIGYLTNQRKRQKLSDHAYRRKVAKALAHGVQLYFAKKEARKAAKRLAH